MRLTEKEQCKKYLGVLPETFKKRIKNNIRRYYEEQYDEKEGNKVSSKTLESSLYKEYYTNPIIINTYEDLCNFLKIPRFSNYHNEKKEQFNLLKKFMNIEEEKDSDPSRYIIYACEKKPSLDLSDLIKNKDKDKDKKEETKEQIEPKDRLNGFLNNGSKRIEQKTIKDVLTKSQIDKVCTNQNNKGRNKTIDFFVEYMFITFLLLLDEADINPDLADVDKNSLLVNTKGRYLSTVEISKFAGLTTEKILRLKDPDKTKEFALENKIPEEIIYEFVENNADQYKRRIEKVIKTLVDAGFITHIPRVFGQQYEECGKKRLSENRDYLIIDLQNSEWKALDELDIALVEECEKDAAFKALDCTDDDKIVEYMTYLKQKNRSYKNEVYRKGGYVLDNYYNYFYKNLAERMKLVNIFKTNYFKYNPVLLTKYLDIVKKDMGITAENEYILSTIDDDIRVLVGTLMNKNLLENATKRYDEETFTIRRRYGKKVKKIPAPEIAKKYLAAYKKTQKKINDVNILESPHKPCKNGNSTKKNSGEKKKDSSKIKLSKEILDNLDIKE